MVNVLIIEGQALARYALEKLFLDIKGINLIDIAPNGKEGIALSREKHPDVVIIEFCLPDTNGFELINKLLRYEPKLKIIVFTDMDSPSLSIRLLEEGVSGFVLKNNGIMELETAINNVHKGQRYISPDMASKIALHKTNGKGDSPFSALSNREREIVLLLVSGMTVDKIAKKLCIAKKTVHTYRYRIFDKLGIGRSDIALLILAVKSGIIELDAKSL